MKQTHIERQFAAMGARFRIAEYIANRFAVNANYSVDIRKDRRGEFFVLNVPHHLREAMEVVVLQKEAADRHLLLLVKRVDRKEKDRFLCGHDERSWFVAAVPGNASTVFQAKEALKPFEVRSAQSAARISARKRNHRNNSAFRRQGEWFFVPAPDLSVNSKFILRNEPIRRGSGKAHIVQEAYRTGGETVYVHRKYPNGVTKEEYKKILERGGTRMGEWNVMVRNAWVYARGEIRHPDHKTITLHGWHRVLMNTENRTRSMANMAFLD